jgi:transposase InsO family protein
VTGKIERFHLTLRRELLDAHEPFTCLADAQVAVDAFVAEYNADRPRQALDEYRPVMPADRFTPVPVEQRQLIELWLPAALCAVVDPAPSTGHA